MGWGIEDPPLEVDLGMEEVGSRTEEVGSGMVEVGGQSETQLK